jgi:hypothetical protein
MAATGIFGNVRPIGGLALLVQDGMEGGGRLHLKMETHMDIRCLRFVVLVSAFSLSALLVGVATANAAAKKKGPSARDAAMEQCIAKAQGAAPGILPTEGPGRSQRVAVYKDCMTQAGYRP